MPRKNKTENQTENKDHKTEHLNATARCENSVIKIFTTHRSWDYTKPWHAPEHSHSAGTGFIVNYNNQSCLITNAHVAGNSEFMEVQLADEPIKYLARIKTIDHDCDLAMLEVDSTEFWHKVKPLELDEMPNMREHVTLFGFPMGGNELCITEGKISRIEVNTYAHSSTSLLQTQVSAAMNPGNSGGPVLNNQGKIIGVAFQGCNKGDALNYTIPPPILKHFIQDALSGEPYKGFPNLAIDIQEIKSKDMRAYYGLSEKQTGIRIKDIDKLSSAKNILQKDDILLNLDGHQIQDDGTIEMPFSKRIDFPYLFSQKQIGESIKATVLRDKVVVDLEIPLLHRDYTTKYSQSENEKAPTYYIHSGIVLQPLTDNFADEAKFNDDNDEDLDSYKTIGKKQLGDEIVILNQVLTSEETRHASAVSEISVKRINGHKIHNLREAMDALKNNTEDMHTLILSDNDVLVIKNLSREQNKALLKTHGIKKDRSIDLKSDPVYRPGCPEAEHKPLITPAFENARKDKKRVRFVDVDEDVGVGLEEESDQETREHKRQKKG